MVCCFLCCSGDNECLVAVAGPSGWLIHYVFLSQKFKFETHISEFEMSTCPWRRILFLFALVVNTLKIGQITIHLFIFHHKYLINSSNGPTLTLPIPLFPNKFLYYSTYRIRIYLSSIKNCLTESFCCCNCH